MNNAACLQDFFCHLQLFWQVPAQRWTLIFLVLTGASGFIGFFITPIIWNFYLIPRIERRVGEKFELSPWLNFFLFDFWICPQMDVTKIIVKRYIAFKRGNPFLNTKPAPGKIKMFWLARVNYDIREASKFEIFMAFFTLVIGLMVPLCIAAGLIIIKFFN